MVFAGLVGAPLLYLGLCLCAAICVLYVLRLRRRPLSVPFSPLWQRILKEQNNTRWRNKLRRWLSLILQLLLAGLLLLALSDPEQESNVRTARHVVVLVDTSASMQTMDSQPANEAPGATDRRTSRLERAKEEALKLIDGLALKDRMLIVRLGMTPQPATPFTDSQQQLREGVGDLSAKDVASDLGLALAFARDALAGLSNPEIVLISDGAYPDEQLDAIAQIKNAKLAFVPLGGATRNIAITKLSVRRYPLDKSRYEVHLEVSNFSEESAVTELHLTSDGDPIEVTTLRLAPGESLARSYKNLSGADQTLEARLKPEPGTDFLPVDDVAYAVLPKRRRAKVLVVSSGNTYLEAALLLDEYLDVTVSDAKDPIPQTPFDVTILDGVAPTLSKFHGSAIYLKPPVDSSPIPYRKRRRTITGFGFDTWDKTSPLLQWMAVENIQVATGYALEPATGDKVVGASELGPILVAGQRDQRQIVVLGFDPRDSDFVLRVAWPLFLLNTINSFTSDSAELHSSLPTGTAWPVTVSDTATKLRVQAPDGNVFQVAAANGQAAIFAEKTGFYRVQADDETQSRLLAANLTRASESDVAPIESLSIGEDAVRPPAGFEAKTRFELWRYIVLAVLLLSGLEWISYHRRLTV